MKTKMICGVLALMVCATASSAPQSNAEFMVERVASLRAHLATIVKEAKAHHPELAASIDRIQSMAASQKCAANNLDCNKVLYFYQMMAVDLILETALHHTAVAPPAELDQVQNNEVHRVLAADAKRLATTCATVDEKGQPLDVTAGTRRVDGNTVFECTLENGHRVLKISSIK